MTDQPHTKICIDTPGPTITIEAGVDLVTALAAALVAFDHVYQRSAPRHRPDLVHGVGFATDRRDTPDAQPSSMYWAPGQYPIQTPGGPE